MLDANVEVVEWTPELNYRIQTDQGVLFSRFVILATGDGSVSDMDFVSTLNLDKDSSGKIIVDERYGTSNIRLYAVGDVVSEVKNGLSSALGTGFAAARQVYDRIQVDRLMPV